MLGWQERFKDAQGGADSLPRPDSSPPAAVPTGAQEEINAGANRSN